MRIINISSMISTIFSMLWFNLNDNVEFVAYHLKDVAWTWYVKWTDNRALRGSLVTWKICNEDFLDRFIPRELREVKWKNSSTFIKELRGYLTTFYKFTKLSKYTPSGFKTKGWDETLSYGGVGWLGGIMLFGYHDNMNICRLVGDAQQLDETMKRRKSREAKKAKS